MKKNTSSRFVIVALVLTGCILLLAALFFKSYLLMILGLFWLIMPFTVSFTYKEPEIDKKKDTAGNKPGEQSNSFIDSPSREKEKSY